MKRILLAPSLALARTVQHPDITIEAEYGGEVVHGSVFTAAHHQKHGIFSRENSPAPCNNNGIQVITDGTILLSHLDLDCIAGCIRTYPNDLFNTSELTSFWRLAEFIDLNGVHKIGLSGATPEDIRAFYAYCAVSKDFPRFPADKISDVTEVVEQAWQTLRAILIDKGEKVLSLGDRFASEQESLNRRTFLSFDSDAGVILRTAKSKKDFCNHLYTGPDGQVAKAVVAFNKENGSITVSFADPIPWLSCRAIVQGLWGHEAGGHDGIAGSPRGQVMSLSDFSQAYSMVCELIKKN